jgi:hypothetical protein
VGSAPRSVAEHDGLDYVLTTGEPSVMGFRLSGSRVMSGRWAPQVAS